MTFSYDASEPADRDQVRGKIGDTVEDTRFLEDETIDAILTNYPSVLAASVEALKRIIAVESRKFDRSALGLSASRGSVVQQLRDLLEEIKSELGGDAGMFVGGASFSDAEALEGNADFIQPKFKVGAFDNPGGDVSTE